MATTIVERDTSSPVTAVLIFFLFVVLLAGGIWFAYSNGLMNRSTIIENHKTFVVPPSVPNPAPSVPAPANPAPAPSPSAEPSAK